MHTSRREYVLIRVPSRQLMRHGINDVVHADPDAEGGVFLGVVRSIGPLPGIADVGLEGDGHHQTPAVVIDAAPAVGAGLALVGAAALYRPLAGHLVAVVEIVNAVENGVDVG